MNKIIPFSPPDISDVEINEVVDTLRSGWITTGPKTKKFEQEISRYCGSDKTICLSSATAGLELILRLFDIGEGDEVITTPFTYAATANVILHTGAKPVFADIKNNDFNISPENIEKLINKKTKAVIPVDIGGYPADYDKIKSIINDNIKRFCPKKNTVQEVIGRPVLISDSAHSFGATYKEKRIGNVADFTVFSFHAVKNLTTAEGGAITFNSTDNLNSSDIYDKLQLLSLHGQSKDALSKLQSGSWHYSIEIPGYKHNMTDIQAALGLAQLSRYESELLPTRRNVFQTYLDNLNDPRFILPKMKNNEKLSSCHLFQVRIKDIDEIKRNMIIEKMSKEQISTNVHYIPVVMHPAYKKLGYKMTDYPNAFSAYKNEISLPIYSTLHVDDAIYIAKKLKNLI